MIIQLLFTVITKEEIDLFDHSKDYTIQMAMFERKKGLVFLLRLDERNDLNEEEEKQKMNVLWAFVQDLDRSIYPIPNQDELRIEVLNAFLHMEWNHELVRDLSSEKLLNYKNLSNTNLSLLNLSSISKKIVYPLFKDWSRKASEIDLRGITIIDGVDKKIIVRSEDLIDFSNGKYTLEEAVIHKRYGVVFLYTIERNLFDENLELSLESYLKKIISKIEDENQARIQQ